MSHTAAGAESWRPLGLAVRAFLDGELDAAVELTLEDGRLDALPAAALFRVDGFPEAEATALALATGRVLDIGAGAGAHSLALQERDLAVTAIDVSPEAVEAMRERGVLDARIADIFHWSSGSVRFDTIVLLMNGLGVAGDLVGLEALLGACRPLLAAGGSVLADGADLMATDEPREHALMARRTAAGRYRGEVRYRARFGVVEGTEFPWLFIDFETLETVADRVGWYAQAIFRDDDDGSYLARLTPRHGDVL